MKHKWNYAVHSMLHMRTSPRDYLGVSFVLYTFTSMSCATPHGAILHLGAAFPVHLHELYPYAWKCHKYRVVYVINPHTVICPVRHLHCVLPFSGVTSQM